MQTIIYRNTDLICVGVVPPNGDVIDKIQYDVIPYFGGNTGDYSSIETNETDFHLETINGIVTVVVNAPSLSDTQQSKIEEIENAYQQALANGFPSSATGTEYTFRYKLEDQVKFMQLGIGLDKGVLTFPVKVPTIAGTRIPHDQAQYAQLVKDIAAFQEPLETKLHDLLDAIEAAGSVDQVNTIHW